MKFLILWMFFLTSFINFGNVLERESCDIQTADSSEFYLNSGNLYYSKGNYSMAEVYLTKAILYNSKNLQALRLRGWCYIALQQYNKAIVDANQICSIDSKGVPEAYSIRGSALMYLGKNAESIVDFNTYVKLVPNSYVGYKLRSGAYTRLKEYGKAIDDLTLAIKVSDNTTLEQMYYQRGKVYWTLSKLIEARADFATCVKLNPNSGDGYRGMAFVDSKNGDYATAFKEINHAIELSKTIEELKPNFYAKTTILFDSGDYGSCIKACDLYTQIDTTVSEIYLLRAKSSYTLYGVSGKEIVDLDKAISLDPSSVESYLYKGIVYNDQAMYKLALDAFTKSISLNKGYSSAYAHRSLTYLKLKNLPLAQESMNTALKLDSVNYEIINMRGAFYMETGQFDRALKDFNYVLNKKPSLIATYVDISKALLNLDRYKEGLDNINTYLSKGGKLTGDVKFTRAFLNMNLNNLPDAEKEFDVLIQEGYNTGMCYLYAGICYKTEELHFKALSYLQNAEQKGVGDMIPLLYESKGQVLMALGDDKGAIVEYTKLITILPEYGQAYLSRGQSYMELKAYNEVISDFKKGISLTTNKEFIAAASSVLSMAYVLTDKLDEALNVLNNVSPETLENKMQVGIMKVTILTAKMEYEKAFSTCNELLKLDGSNPIVLKYRGLLQMVQQNYNTAVDDFIKITELYPNEPGAYSVLYSSTPTASAVLYKNARINNLVLYKDTATNTLTINFMLDDAHRDEMLNKLKEALDAKIQLRKEKYNCYLLLAEFNKVLSTNTSEALNGYDKAIVANSKSGMGYYLRGMFKKENLKDSVQGCIDINKAKSLGVKTDACK